MLTKEQLINLVSNYFKKIDRMPSNAIEHKNLYKLLSDMVDYDIITENEKDAIFETLETYAIDHYNYFNQCHKFGDCRLEFAEISIAAAKDIISNAEFMATI